MYTLTCLQAFDGVFKESTLARELLPGVLSGFWLEVALAGVRDPIFSLITVSALHRPLLGVLGRKPAGLTTCGWNLGLHPWGVVSNDSSLLPDFSSWNKCRKCREGKFEWFYNHYHKISHKSELGCFQKCKMIANVLPLIPVPRMMSMEPWQNVCNLHIWMQLSCSRQDYHTYPKYMGPVVQNIVSLTSLLMTNSLTVIAKVFSNTLKFLLQKCKSYSHFFFSGKNLNVSAII